MTLVANIDFWEMVFDFSDPSVAQIGENDTLEIVSIFKSLNLSQFHSLIASQLFLMEIMSVIFADLRRLIKELNFFESAFW